MKKNLSIAVDIGGTFTDLLGFDSSTGQIYQSKSLSTPHDFAIGVMDCVKKAAVQLDQVNNFVHGSTVAINTAIEKTGAKTALLVTQGTRDVYLIGRGNRPEAYNIFFQRAEPLASPSLTFEIEQRTTAWGDSYVSFNEEQALGIVKEVENSDAQAVAVCFLHSYENPDDEIRMGNLLNKFCKSKFVTLSHEISRKYGEYERMSTTVLNAYIGPKTSSYLRELENLLSNDGFQGRLLIMQSNGGLMSANMAKRIPVAMMESGPVGGVIAAAQISSNLGYENTIAFDMGGTTAKSSLVNGREVSITEGYYIGGYAAGYPAMMPVVDIVEVGTGGGSIAWIDDVGALKVGPLSAGADPGPISYGRGGNRPTVTDANVVLGRIGDKSFLGGEMPLDRNSALLALTELGKDLGLNGIEMARSIVEIAVSKMSLAVRGVSVERGFDPRDFAMVAMGGAGPIHALAIARELHIPTVIIPVLPAHFSALGMLLCDLRHDYVRTHLGLLDSLRSEDVHHVFDEMISEGCDALKQEGVNNSAMKFQRYIDLRYEGQEFSLQVPVSDTEILKMNILKIRKRFDEMHDRNFGHSAPDEPLEVVNLRLTAKGVRSKVKMPNVIKRGKPIPMNQRNVCLGKTDRFIKCPVFFRPTLAAGAKIEGPAIIEEYASTTVLFEGDHATISPTGEVVIKVKVTK